MVLKHFKDPLQKKPLIHLTGTNGKGSVSLKLATIFQNSGFKTGLFTSPHVFTFRERIQIDGKLISENDVAEKLHEIFEISDKLKIQLTYFDYVWILCAIYFEEQNIDIGVIEAGLGCTLDSTCTLKPILSVVTSIGLDHCDSLGHTVDEIARDKSGIIKENTPVVIGPNSQPYFIFQDKARMMKSEIKIVENKQYNDFDEENNQIVLDCIQMIKNYYPQYNVIQQNDINAGLNKQQICRQEYLSQELKIANNIKADKQVIFDVGHNPPALKKLLTQVKQNHSDCKIVVMYGTSPKKDFHNSLQIISEYADKIYLIKAKHERVLDFQSLSFNNPKIHSYYENGDICKNLKLALKELDKSEAPEILLVVGSFYIMPEARQYFDKNIVIENI